MTTSTNELAGSERIIVAFFPAILLLVTSAASCGGGVLNTRPAEHPIAADCVIEAHGEAPRFLPPLTLRTVKGEVFARLTAADDVRMNGPVLLVSVYGLRLRQRPRVGELPVYVRSPHRFGSILYAEGRTKLAWMGSSGPHGTLDVQLPEDARITWVVRPSSVTASCNDLALTPQAAIQPDSSSATLESMQFLADASGARRIAISDKPGGASVAELLPPPSATVSVLERSGTAARIEWRVEDGSLADARITGWVAQSALEPATSMVATGEASSGGITGSSEWRGCASPHPLHVSTRAGIEEIGEISAGTRVEVNGQEGLWSSVEILGPAVHSSVSPLELPANVKFLMRTPDAADCQ